MSGFFKLSKRRFGELFLGFSIFLFILIGFDALEVGVLFIFGFIWNWVSAQPQVLDGVNQKQYKYSTLRLVFGLQDLIEKYFKEQNTILKFFLKSSPAGVFWFFVIYFISSDLPWWSVFLGSLIFELMNLVDSSSSDTGQTI